MFKQVFFCILVLSIISCNEKEIGNDRDKFLGAYDVIENCSNGSSNYELSIIVSGATESSVILDNLGSNGEFASGEVEGNLVTIPTQILGDGSSLTGTGMIELNVLTINYSFIRGGNIENCNAVCTQR